MPITIGLPQPGPVIGPGFNITLTSDFIGPLAIGAYWAVRISRDAEGADVCTSRQRVWQFNRNFWMFGGHEEYAIGGPFPSSAIADGESIWVTAFLVDDTGTVDTGAEQATWSTALAQDAIQDLIMNDTGGALTPTQATQLAETHESVLAGFSTALGTVRQIPIDSIVPHPPIEQLGFIVGAFEITGRGELTVPIVAGLPLAYGLAFTATTVPAGFGRRDGYVLEYTERLGQFLALRPSADNTGSFVVAPLDLHLAAFTWFWNVGAVEFIAYDVTPGVTIQCRWVGLLS